MLEMNIKWCYHKWYFHKWYINYKYDINVIQNKFYLLKKKITNCKNIYQYRTIICIYVEALKARAYYKYFQFYFTIWLNLSKLWQTNITLISKKILLTHLKAGAQKKIVCGPKRNIIQLMYWCYNWCKIQWGIVGNLRYSNYNSSLSLNLFCTLDISRNGRALIRLKNNTTSRSVYSSGS